MSDLKDQIKKVLDECRILILGTQVLLGVELRAVFEEGFDHLTAAARVTLFCGITLLSVTLACLFVPATYNLIVDRGNDTVALSRLATLILEWTLLPCSIGLGCLFFVGGTVVASDGFAIAMAVGVSAVALLFWYGIEWMSPRRLSNVPPKQEDVTKADPKEKVDHVLQETRMVLPGAQALLGFQFASFLASGFAKLPSNIKLVHLSGLALVALSTILLIAPSAYHRIVERGNNSERFHTVASRFLLCAIGVLGLGLAVEFAVVLWIVTKSDVVCAAAGIGLLICSYTLWFLFPLYRRATSSTS